jgi:hypothetical protein
MLPTGAIDATAPPFMNQVDVLPAGVAPRQVTFATTIEVSGQRYRPGGRHVADAGHDTIAAPFISQVEVLPRLSALVAGLRDHRPRPGHGTRRDQLRLAATASRNAIANTSAAS